MQGDALGRMFAFNRRLVQLAAGHKKPAPEAVKALAGELVGLGGPIKDVEKNFKSAFVNHAKAAHESVAAFQWVLADNGGLGLVEAAREGADFWANKVGGWVVRGTARPRGCVGLVAGTLPATPHRSGSLAGGRAAGTARASRAQCQRPWRAGASHGVHGGRSSMR